MSASVSIGGNNPPPPPSWTLTVQRRDRKTWTAVRERVDADVVALRLTSVELEEILKQLHAVALPNARIRGEVRALGGRRLRWKYTIHTDCW